MFRAAPPSPSLVDTATTTGRPFRRCALAAMVTEVSAMPLANLARVLPVQGAMTSTSSSCLGPMGSASRTDSTAPWPQISSAACRKSAARPNRVSVAPVVSDRIGTILGYSLAVSSMARMAFSKVQNDPVRANPTRASPMVLTPPIPKECDKQNPGWPLPQ